MRCVWSCDVQHCLMRVLVALSLYPVVAVLDDPNDVSVWVIDRGWCCKKDQRLAVCNPSGCGAEEDVWSKRPWSSKDEINLIRMHPRRVEMDVEESGVDPQANLVNG